MCVCHPWNHRDALNAFAVVHFTAGGLVVHASTSPTKRLALNTDIGGDAHRRTCNFPTFPYGKRLSQEPHCKALMFSLNCRCERNVVSLFVRRSLSSFWALLPLADLQDPLVRTCTLRKWNPRPACGTAIKSVRISMSVCTLLLLLLLLIIIIITFQHR